VLHELQKDDLGVVRRACGSELAGTFGRERKPGSPAVRIIGLAADQSGANCRASSRVACMARPETQGFKAALSLTERIRS